MEAFREKKFTAFFNKSVLAQMFDWVLNMPLLSNKNSIS